MGSAQPSPDQDLNAIKVDDSDPRIVYKEPQWWTAGGTSFEYNNTSHGSFDNGATMSFTFNGTSIDVYGTLGKSNGSLIPCGIFEVGPLTTTVTAQPAPSQTMFNQQFYSSGELPAGTYTLTFTVDTHDQNCGADQLWPMWIDYLEYMPTSTVPSTSSSPPVVSSNATSLSTQFTSPAANTNSKVLSNIGPIVAGTFVGGVLIGVLTVIAVLWRRKKQALKRGNKTLLEACFPGGGPACTEPDVRQAVFSSFLPDSNAYPEESPCQSQAQAIALPIPSEEHTLRNVGHHASSKVMPRTQNPTRGQIASRSDSPSPPSVGAVTGIASSEQPPGYAP